MTALTALLSRKYPRAKYPPREACQYCNGRGEINGKQGVKPCVCLFVQHELIEMSLKVLPLAMLDALGLDAETLKTKIPA